MKPNWNEAPEWAKYLAQDFNGRWYWYASRPFPAGSEGTWRTHGDDIRFAPVTPANPFWDETLEERPE